MSSGDGKPSSFCFFFLDRKDKNDFESLALFGGSVPADRSPESNGDGRLPSWAWRRVSLIISLMFIWLRKAWLAPSGTPDPYIAAFDDTESVLFRDLCPNLPCGEADKFGVVADGKSPCCGLGLLLGLSLPMARRVPASPDSLAPGL